eukprot:11138671-Lingulodinium_polyedra.AAC.1
MAFVDCVGGPPRHCIVLISGLPEETGADAATAQISRYGVMDFIAFERGSSTVAMDLRFLRVYV